MLTREEWDALGPSERKRILRTLDRRISRAHGTTLSLTILRWVTILFLAWCISRWAGLA